MVKKMPAFLPVVKEGREIVSRRHLREKYARRWRSNGFDEVESVLRLCG